jgi:hypothetical protein
MGGGGHRRCSVTVATFAAGVLGTPMAAWAAHGQLLPPPAPAEANVEDAAMRLSALSRLRDRAGKGAGVAVLAGQGAAAAFGRIGDSATGWAPAR